MARSNRRVQNIVTHLKFDPLPWLLSSRNEAITTFVRRDLLGERVRLEPLRNSREALRLVSRQQPDGSWRYPTPKPPPQKYDLYETLNTLGILLYKYALDHRHPTVEKAAAYIISCQTADGDYRGIYGNQPAHTYSPVLMELLIDAGYKDHPSIEKAFAWLLDTRQDDGGWAIPVRTRDIRLVKEWDAICAADPVEADRSKPFSHMVTGMALRPFTAHPRYLQHPAAKLAAGLLKSRLFKSDKYADRRGKAYWLKFTYPFVFTDLLTALDTLGRMGYPADDPDIARGIGWFRDAQSPDGSFDLNIRRGRDKQLPYWLGYAVCRALRRFSG